MGPSSPPHRDSQCSRRPELMAKITRVVRFLKGLCIMPLWWLAGVRFQGRMVLQGRSPAVHNEGRIVMGQRVLFRGVHGRVRLSTGPDGLLLIGKRSFINSNCSFHATKRVEIGDHCLIGENVVIDDCSHHSVDQISDIKMESIKLGKNVWIANNVTIMPGVSIGDHSVVAAGSVVTRSFEDRVLIAGVPARVVRKLTASEEWIRR